MELKSVKFSELLLISDPPDQQGSVMSLSTDDIMGCVSWTAVDVDPRQPHPAGSVDHQRLNGCETRCSNLQKTCVCETRCCPVTMVIRLYHMLKYDLT